MLQMPQACELRFERPRDGALLSLWLRCRDMSLGYVATWPWVKILHPIPTKIDKNGWCTYPKMVPLVLTHSHIRQPPHPPVSTVEQSAWRQLFTVGGPAGMRSKCLNTLLYIYIYMYAYLYIQYAGI